MLFDNSLNAVNILLIASEGYQPTPFVRVKYTVYKDPFVHDPYSDMLSPSLIYKSWVCLYRIAITLKRTNRPFLVLGNFPDQELCFLNGH